MASPSSRANRPAASSRPRLRSACPRDACSSPLSRSSTSCHSRAWVRRVGSCTLARASRAAHNTAAAWRSGPRPSSSYATAWRACSAVASAGTCAVNRAVNSADARSIAAASMASLVGKWCWTAPMETPARAATLRTLTPSNPSSTSTDVTASSSRSGAWVTGASSHLVADQYDRMVASRLCRPRTPPLRAPHRSTYSGESPSSARWPPTSGSSPTPRAWSAISTTPRPPRLPRSGRASRRCCNSWPRASSSACSP